MSHSYIKKSLYLVNRLDLLPLAFISGHESRRIYTPEIAESGSSLRSFGHIANDRRRRPEEIKHLPAGLVFED